MTHPNETKSTVVVRYIGKPYARFFGTKDYIATARHVRCNGNEPVHWYIIDPDGDSYTVAKGTLNEGLVNGWIIIT